MLYNLNLMSRELVLLILLACYAGCSQQCAELMFNWLLHPEHLPAEVYMNSGKFINDLGDYNNCLYNKDQYTYFTMRFVNKMVGMQYIGLCAPNNCKQEIATNTYGTKMQDYLNALYMQKTGSATGIFFKTTFYIPVQAGPVMDWSNYLVLAGIGLIMGIGVLGSFVSRRSSSNSKAVQVLKCFSFVDNFRKIITVPKTNQNQNLLFLNGLRVMCIFWVVFGHDMWFRFMNIKNWMETLKILMTPGIATLVPGAYFAVDIFFWIGGFLVTIGMVSQLSKTRSFIKFYFFCILHRFIRIWPTYMLAILIYWKVAPFLSSGPIALSSSIFANSCANWGILWNMFFVDNFGDHGPSGMNYCFGWGWYLAVDFQLFLITPFIIFAFAKNKKLGWIITFLLCLASVICAFVMVMVKDWRYPIPNPKMKPQPEFMDEFYYKPYIRSSAYFMGILSGFLYCQWKQGNAKTLKIVNHIKNSIPIRISFYIIGMFLCQLTIWIIMPFQTGKQWSTVAHAFYNSLNRIVFLIGVYLCVFAAMFGCQNDPSKYILGHRMFSPLAKVSFCVYLTHLIVIMGNTFSSKMDLYWQPYSAVYISISDIFWSFVAATMLSLLAEAPTLGLEKILMHNPKKDKKKKEIKEQLVFKQQTQNITLSKPSIMTSSDFSDTSSNKGEQQ